MLQHINYVHSVLISLKFCLIVAKSNIYDNYPKSYAILKFNIIIINQKFN